ncbi:MAG: TlpA family protein disulfide reductase [Methanobrevibacter sp.]|nr:TlpA family protein disulfide reductase [Methanobrevibacter sp.]
MNQSIIKQLVVFSLCAIIFLGCEKKVNMDISNDSSGFTESNESDQVTMINNQNEEINNENHFETIDLNDNLVDETIFANYKITIIDYWATYCSYCKDDMPKLEEFRATLPDDVSLLGAVSVIDRNEDGSRTERDDENTIESAKDVVAETGITYNTIVANDSFKDTMNLTIRLFPTLFFVDSEGNVIENSIIDGFDANKINAMLTEYLKTGVIADTHYSEDYAKELESQPIPYDVNDKITLVDGTKIIVMNDLNGNLIGIPEELKDEFYTKQFQIGDSITEEDFESWVNDVKRDIPKK